MPDSPTSPAFLVYIDGASRGNPGPAAYAVIVKTAGGARVASFAKPLGRTTNNFAEYQALLAALDYGIGQGRLRLKIYSDSELMVRQIQGRYKVKSDDLKPLYQRARQMIRQLDSFSMVHIPREKNREADRLANRTLDTGKEQKGNPGDEEVGSKNDQEQSSKTHREVLYQGTASAVPGGSVPSPPPPLPASGERGTAKRGDEGLTARLKSCPDTRAAGGFATAASEASPQAGVSGKEDGYHEGGTDLSGEPQPAARAPLTELTEEERMLEATAYQFAVQEVGPHVREMDRQGAFRKELLDQLFVQGFMGLSIPEAYGGSGGSFFMSVLAIEAFARVDASASVIIDVQNTLVSNALLRWGNKAQKQTFLPRLARDTVGAYALSEPNAGSDAFGLATRATEDGEGYALNGRKLWITNAEEAGLFIVFATVNRDLGYRGITAFLVERATPGFSVGKKEDKLGIRASSTCELILEDCRVPKTHVLGEAGQGYKVAIETLNEGRIGIGAQMAGIARGALDQAVAYAKERRQFGKPIADFQAIRFQIAQLATEVEAARLLTYNAARLKDAGQPFAREAAMAKYFASQVAERVASEAIEIFGGYGFTKDYPAEKYLRDAKIGKIYEGTSFMQLQTIAKLILGT